MFSRKWVVSCKFRHAVYGMVDVRVVASSHKLTAHWEGPLLRVNIPPYVSVEKLNEFLDNSSEQLLSLRPSLNYRLGQRIDAGEIDFLIARSTLPLRENVITITKNAAATPQGKECEMIVNLTDDIAARIETMEVQSAINKLIFKSAQQAVWQFVVPRARRLAASFGLQPSEWRVRHCKRSYGSCNGKGIITLDPLLIFMPSHLRDFIICHELAHLSEMNHSAAFHRICNAYCGGHEKEYEAELKKFKPPTF